MSIQVKSIDTQTIKERLKKSGDKKTLNYIKKLEESIERWKKLTHEALNKLKNL